MGTHPRVLCDIARFMGRCAPATGTVSAGAGAVNIMGSNPFEQVRDYIPDFEPQTEPQVRFTFNAEL